MHCFECGFEFDEVNESQPVCPRCGADPNEHEHPLSALDPEIPGIIADEARELIRPDPIVMPGNNLIN